MQIDFILVQPAVPENVGAAARAINTMGFNQLVIVNSTAHLQEPAKWLAHGSANILNKAISVNSLDDILHNYDFLIATTAQKRSAYCDNYTPENCIDILNKKQKSIHKIGIVFGSEENGLCNSIIQMCDITSSIPIVKPYPSINLGQSVMLYAYVLSNRFINQKDTKKIKPNKDKYKQLKSIIQKVLLSTAINKNENLSKRIFERVAYLDDNDTNLVLSICNKIIKKI